jgi:hypothetical protein
MAIWGNRDRESADETSAEVTPAAATPGNDPSATAVPEGGAHESEPPSGEPAPAFWRAQGRPLAPGYEPADEPEPGSGRVPAEAAAPPVSEAPAGTDAPAPVLDEDVVVLDSEAAVKDPALTETARDPAETAGEPAVSPVPPTATAAPSPAGAPAPAAAVSPGSADSPGSISPQRWSEILVSFVDNPRGSVKMAADAVDSAIEEVVASVRARQRALASSWQGSETDTEQLRIALREYRRFGAQVRQMSPAEPARPDTAAAS